MDSPDYISPEIGLVFMLIFVGTLAAIEWASRRQERRRSRPLAPASCERLCGILGCIAARPETECAKVEPITPEDRERFIEAWRKARHEQPKWID